EIAPIIIRTGIEVPIPNTAGRKTPYDEVKTTGINVTKNNTNIDGQKAIEKLTPIINEPVFPLLSFIGILLEILLMIFSLIYPNKNIPTKIRSGPITFRKNGNKIVIFSSKFWP